MRRSTLFGLVAAAVLCVAGVAGIAAADGPRWSLGYSHDTPTWVRVPSMPGRSAIVWAMTYTVENKSGASRSPTLRTEIRTETGKTYGDSGDPLALAALKRKIGVKEISTAADLKAGLDDGAAVKCAATFGAIDDRAHSLELRVYGLADAISVVRGRKFYEVKYWRVLYERKGDEFRRAEDPWKLVSSGWVVESTEAIPDKEK